MVVSLLFINYIVVSLEQVTVNSAPSLDYTLTPLSSDQYTSCLCANERKTLSWTMTPSVLGVVNVTVSAEAVASDILCGNKIVNVPDRGRIDVVTRSLIVKAEGTELTKTHNWLLCPKGGFGLDQTFGPMTDTASERSGLQLTAFVVRCFAKAQSFVYIDPKNIAASKLWLKTHQRENGCFMSSGKLFNNRMKGGVSDEVTLSAYITAAFLEMNISDSEDVVKKSLSCLKESIGNLSNTYTTALLAYVFTLAGDTETRGHL
ncbi:hypothetical protein INR49_003137, partial [Caranx melampygus]